MKILRWSIFCKLIVAIISLGGGWSCGVTRHIPDGEYLLKHVDIEESEDTPKKERIPYYDMERYVRQAPNKKLFGSNFYIWIYNSANPEKDNWWNKLKRKIGEEPIYYSEELSEKSVANLKIYMDSQGYYASTSQFEVDTTLKRKRAKVTYKTRQGRPYLIDSIKYTFRDTMLRRLVLQDSTKSLLHRGDVFSVALLDKERERLTSRLRSYGYFNFSVNNIEYLADTLMGDKRVMVDVIIKKHLSGYDERGVAIMTDNKRFRVDEINIFPNFDPTVVANDTTFLNKIDTIKWRGLNVIHYKDEDPNVKAKVLRQAVAVYPGRMFNYQDVNQTYLNLMSIGYFKSARISFSELSGPIFNSDSLFSRRRPPIEESVESSSPIGYLSSYILCTPTLKQSFNVELEASTTSSFYGLTATVGYQNRNIFRGTESLDVDFVMGYEHMKAPDAIKTRATELGVSVGLSIPRFIIPTLGYRFPMALKPRTKIEASVNFQDRPYYNRILSSLNLSYSWLTKKYSSLTVRPIDINLIDMKYIDSDYYDQLENEYLKNSYQTQLVTGLTSSYVYNNQGRNINGHVTTLRVNLETAGNSVQAFKELTNASTDSDGDYKLFNIAYAQYVRADVNLSRKFEFYNGTAIAGRLFSGVGVPYGNSSALPFDRLFYSGGSNSMRGWTPRTLGPGNSELPEDMVYPTQLGDIKLEANLEYRFPIWGMVHGATFADVGNVWYLPNDYEDYDEASIFRVDKFYKQLGFNVGYGFRLDIQFAVLRLDWGIQIHNPNEPAGQRWISGFDFSKTALNFGVGYPF